MSVDKSNHFRFLADKTYVRVRRSAVHGVGLFAIKNISKGVNPFESLMDTKYITYKEEELCTLDPEIKKMINDYCAQTDGYYYIPESGFNPIDLLHFINHSESPNVETKDGGNTFFANRDIKKGEELFSNYRTYEDKFPDQPLLTTNV